jgi:hypothetical protein
MTETLWRAPGVILMGPMSEPYIRARDLSRVYQSGAGEMVFIAGLNLDEELEEMLALVGERG